MDMKKNIALIFCFCLLFGLTAGMAATIKYDESLNVDKMVGYGKATGNGDITGAAGDIFTHYTGLELEWKKNFEFESLNFAPPSLSGEGTYNVELLFGKKQGGAGETWSYAIVAANTSGLFYVFENTYSLDDGYGFADDFLSFASNVSFDGVDYWEVDNNGKNAEWIRLDNNVTTNIVFENKNQVDATWFVGDYCDPRIEDCELGMDPVPEPGSILLLGTGILGLGLAARRKLGKK
jgi:hypothetical protein